MNKLKALLAGYFAAYENSGMLAGNPHCTTDELAEAIVAAAKEDADEGNDSPASDSMQESAPYNEEAAAAVVRKKKAKKPVEA